MVQHKVRALGHDRRGQCRGNTLAAQTVPRMAYNANAACVRQRGGAGHRVQTSRPEQQPSDSQTFAAFGPTGGNYSTTAAGFHAHEKTVGAGASGFRCLVGAFHGWAWTV